MAIVPTFEVISDNLNLESVIQ